MEGVCSSPAVTTGAQDTTKLREKFLGVRSVTTCAPTEPQLTTGNYLKMTAIFAVVFWKCEVTFLHEITETLLKQK